MDTKQEKKASKALRVSLVNENGKSKEGKSLSLGGLTGSVRAEKHERDERRERVKMVFSRENPLLRFSVGIQS